ncbi:hypothetical protein [Endozoicomonas ascidiicola]|uniref:hypothetical protein n=1 Tax=Endozoicomonas ascidiicola TaxID=1698521 RepID=UPI000833997A|nr:hypothetical protein [Endozoicomonas ascidiicola]
MNRFKPYLSLFLSIMAIMCSQYTTADSCTAEDTRYAKVWDNYYSPQEAYNVGKILQLLVANKDTRGLYQYVDGELENGPRRSYALSKPFDEVFPKQWVESILSNEPNCSPVGWRGFLLGNGNIWFNKRNGEWKIRAINSASKETITTPSGWSVNH